MGEKVPPKGTEDESSFSKTRTMQPRDDTTVAEKETARAAAFSTVVRRLPRFWRFRLSTLLIVVTLAGAWLAVTFNRESLSRQNLSQLQLRERFDMDIWKVVWRGDGKRVALVGWEQPVQIHDGTTFWRMDTIGQHKKIVHFAFSPDESTVAYCENAGKPCILDVSTGQTRVLDTPPGQWKMAFSPDGGLLAAGSYGNAARLWDVSSGESIHELDIGSATGGLTVVFSPDGKYLAVGNRNASTYIFDVETGQRVTNLPKRMSQELTFHPTLPVIAVAYVDASIGLWNITDGRLLHEVQTTAEEIYTLDWSPDGQLLASAGLRGDVNLWRGDDLTLLHTIAAPEWVISVRFRPDMRGLVVAGGDVERGGQRYVQEFTVPSTAQKVIRGDW
jgi:WD40 repeat protein